MGCVPMGSRVERFFMSYVVVIQAGLRAWTQGSLRPYFREIL